MRSCHPVAWRGLASVERRLAANWEKMTGDSPREEEVALGWGRRSLGRNLPGVWHSHGKRVCTLMGPSIAHRAFCLYRPKSSVLLLLLFCVRTRRYFPQCCSNVGPKLQSPTLNLAHRGARSVVSTGVVAMRQPYGGCS